MHDPKNIKVALLQGGNSSEREISLKSGEGAYEALNEAGYDIDVLDPSEKADLAKLTEGYFDVAFICLHGRGGEDGRIQGFLETIGLPYTCSGVDSSSYCMDKAITKMFYESAGIPTPASIEVSYSDDAYEEGILDITGIIQRKIGNECVIKVPNGGSSIGVYIADGIESMKEALLEAFKESETLLVEQYIAGREVTNVVLDYILDNDGEPPKASFEARALPIIEIIPANDSYDYDSKYLPGGSEHICPAELPADVAAYVQELAVRAHEVLGCRGVSRTDFIIDGEGRPWALETNTVPGMTQTSLLPDAARAAGLSFPEICIQLIENALVR